ncbi:MAG: MATE family efflux transporter [Clostridia bacterium]|nr:MATE family efflux transporter [Clostridia bacterium]
MDKKEAKFIKMTTSPVLPLLLRMSAPAVVSMLISAIYNAADSYFVSSIDKQNGTNAAVGSIGVIFSFMAILQAFGFMFGHGSGNYISRQLGKKFYDDAQKMAVTGVGLSFLTGLVISVFGLIFLDELATFLGSTPTILPYARDYLRFILIAAPFQCAALTMNNQLRFQGNARHGMVGLGVGAVLNMGLDPVLIPHLGVSGAGVATLVGQTLSFVLLLILTFTGGNLPMKPRCFAPTWGRITELLRGGFPSFARQIIGSVATILLNYALKGYGADAAAGGFGDDAIAAMSVIGRITMIVSSIVIGIGQGFQPICGMNYGAGKIDRVLSAFYKAVLLSTGVYVVGALIGVPFAPQILPRFVSGGAVDIGVRALRYQLVPLIFSAYYLTGSMMMQNLGASLKATILAVARQGLTFIPLILILPRVFGLEGALLAQPLSDVLCILIAFPLMIPETRKLKRAAAEIARKEAAV